MEVMHPGVFLLQKLTRHGMSGHELSGLLDVPANRIYAILNGTRSITADTALRLARYYGVSPHVWLSLQNNYDLALAKENQSIMTTITPRNQTRQPHKKPHN